jgi:hypothetical protein
MENCESCNLEVKMQLYIWNGTTETWSFNVIDIDYVQYCWSVCTSSQNICPFFIKYLILESMAINVDFV